MQDNSAASSSSRWYRYTKILDNRKHPIRGLWKTNGNFVGVIHLKAVATGRTVARLEDPFRNRSTWLAFNSDGTQLIVAARYAKTIHVWDLAGIRAGLKTLNLDWDWPDLTDALGKSAQQAALRPAGTQKAGLIDH